MEDKQGGRRIASGCKWCAFHFYIGLLKSFGLSKYGEKKLHDNTIWYVFGGQCTPMGDFDSGGFSGHGNVLYFASQIVKL